jgi:hypothetical protein
MVRKRTTNKSQLNLTLHKVFGVSKTPEIKRTSDTAGAFGTPIVFV